MNPTGNLQMTSLPGHRSVAGLDIAIQAWIKLPRITSDQVVGEVDGRRHSDQPTGRQMQLWYGRGALY